MRNKIRNVLACYTNYLAYVLKDFVWMNVEYLYFYC